MLGFYGELERNKAVSEDVFEPVRRKVRSLQAELRRREDEFHQLQRQTITEHGYMPLHGQYHAIVDIEQEIVRLRASLPPYAVERESGDVELRPVTERIDPRESI